EYTTRCFLPLRDLGAKYAVMQAAMVSAERIFGLLDTAPPLVGGPVGAPGGRWGGVGPRGGGKTTIARLLIRAFDVEQGQVLVDGVDVREWDLESLRRHVGLVLQERFLFTGGGRDNLSVDGAEAGDGASLPT